MASFSIRPATFEDIAAVAAVVRPQDAAECEAASGRNVYDALVYGWPYTEKAWVGMVDGELIGMAGVACDPARPEIGVPWMMSSTKMDEVAMQFLRENQSIVGEMMEGYQLLVNYVDARNVKAIRWLKWLGFRILPIESYGVSGLPFHRFEMEC